MKRSLDRPLKPTDARASIAVDLGAESCRVSLLRWMDGRPSIQLVHRFANNPRELPDEQGGGLRWDLNCIVNGVEDGLRKCAELAPEGIRSVAVSSQGRLYFLRLAMTRSRGNMVEPLTTVAGLMPLTRIMGE